MHTVIFTGGRLRPGASLDEALGSADMIIAADSGAASALGLGVFPSVVIGDFDSLDEKSRKILEREGATFITHDQEKDRTDTELAVDYAVSNRASRITLLGGFEGDRTDHVLANIFSAAGHDVPVRFVSGQMEARILKGPGAVALTGGAGDTVSLLPLTPRAQDVSTAGLKYALEKGNLEMYKGRGVSNVMTRTKAKVDLGQGTLLVVHYRSLPG